jgi:hypothetical protein
MPALVLDPTSRTGSTGDWNRNPGDPFLALDLDESISLT